MTSERNVFLSAKEMLLSGQYQSRPKKASSGWEVRGHPYKSTKNMDKYQKFYHKWAGKESPEMHISKSTMSPIVTKRTESPVIPSAARAFKPPFKSVSVNIDINNGVGNKAQVSADVSESSDELNQIMKDPRAKNLDKNIVGSILDEIFESEQPVDWSDISGLDYAKARIKKIAIMPLLKPHVFVGLLTPPKGLLLFGPPGTGKTLLARCIASQSKSTFFSISASSLTSKWIGEGEKSVRTLFTVARIKAPAIIFIDEIDSLLTSRNDSEHESSRRIKTEFLVQLDGLACKPEDRLLVIGATNRPYELDEALLRRLPKRFYIPLPDEPGRKALISKLLTGYTNTLTDENYNELAKLTTGYSGADIKQLCSEAAELALERMEDSDDDEDDILPPITYSDLLEAIDIIKPSVSEKDLDVHINWNEKYGTIRRRNVKAN